MRLIFSILGICTVFLFITPNSYSSPELDRAYSLERIGFLRAHDNLDGIFGDYIDQIFVDYFQKKSRFQYHSLQKASQILDNAKIPYSKLIQDPEILSQLLRSTRTQSLIRTLITQEGSRYRVRLDWIHAPLKMESPFTLASELFDIKVSERGTGINVSELTVGFSQALDRLLMKVPYIGHITGRDQNTLTLNLGRESGLTVGNLVIIETIDEVKKHPLLAQIVEWKFTKVGEATITEVDDTISFAKVSEQTGSISFARYQKITRFLNAREASDSSEASENRETLIQSDRLPTDKPRIGYAEGALWVGAQQREVSGGSGGDKKEGSGPLLGLKARGQVWFNPSWFSDFQLGYGISSYSQTGAESTSASTFNFRLNGGFHILTPNDFFGPRAWFKLGYHSDSYTQTKDASQRMGSITFSGPFVGIGGTLPLRNEVSVFLDLGLGVLTSATEDISGEKEAKSAQSIWFALGFDYNLSPRVCIRGALEVHSGSAKFLDSPDDSQTNQRRIVFAPALLYYF